MNDSVDVEEILERIRQRARSLARDRDGQSEPEAAPLTLRQKLKNIWGAVKWYAQHPVDFQGTATSRLATARAVDQLQETVVALKGRMDSLEKLEMKHVDPALADSHLGSKAVAGLWFNDPIILQYDATGRPSWSRTSERIIEKAWVLRQLGGMPMGAKILDVGCAESLLSIELASNGFHVTGVDVRSYPLMHPNFNLVRGDVATAPLQTASFDAVILLSTIEHVGLGWYGDERGDAQQSAAIAHLHTLLKPGGLLLVTVPFGKAAMTPLHRIFDSRELRQLLSQFHMQSLEFGIKADEKTWLMPASEDVAGAARYDPETHAPGAVALAAARKHSE